MSAHHLANVICISDVAGESSIPDPLAPCRCWQEYWRLFPMRRNGPGKRKKGFSTYRFPGRARRQLAAAAA
jgi:hypothetical protein